MASRDRSSPTLFLLMILGIGVGLAQLSQVFQPKTTQIHIENELQQAVWSLDRVNHLWCEFSPVLLREHETPAGCEEIADMDKFIDFMTGHLEYVKFGELSDFAETGTLELYLVPYTWRSIKLGQLMRIGRVEQLKDVRASKTIQQSKRLQLLQKSKSFL